MKTHEDDTATYHNDKPTIIVDKNHANMPKLNKVFNIQLEDGIIETGMFHYANDWFSKDIIVDSDAIAVSEEYFDCLHQLHITAISIGELHTTAVRIGELYYYWKMELPSQIMELVNR